MRYTLFFLSLFVFGTLSAQEKTDLGTIHGSLQTDAQYTFKDSTIGAQDKPERILSNTYLQLLYKRGKFETGIRYEMYKNPMLGFDTRYEGLGIPYRYARYQGELIDLTVGNFYEQFGQGSIFRTYQEWTLGIDNSIDGLRVKFRPKKGLTLTGLLGLQRSFWTRSQGSVRAADLDVNLNYLIPSLAKSEHKFLLGASVVSRYQKDNDPVYNLPENVGAASARFAYNYKRFHFDTEVSYKSQDPGAGNGFTYNDGNFAYMNMSYSIKGLGLSTTLKRVDNMDFRSDRLAKLNVQTLSFLPPVTRTHTYRLPTLYPYATQLNGEIGGQFNLYYRFPEEWVGEHDLTISANYSRVHALDTTQLSIVRNINGVDSVLDKGHTYKAAFIGKDNTLLFEDFNLAITKEWTDKFTQKLTYIYLVYNKDIVQFASKNVEYGTIYSHSAILENIYQISDNVTLRNELQHLYINPKNQHQDWGNWAMALLELSVSPTWYFTVFDEWNYGHPDPKKRVHYYSGQVAYVKGAHRIAAGYGRQREGLLCVGGICRVVPASNGFQLSITSSF